MTDKVNYDVRELKLGSSFTNNRTSQYHTIKYDFKPASVDVNKMATVDVGTNNQVTVTVPHLDGAGVPQTVFKGNQRPYTKECVLIIDRVTGEITLEKLSSNIQVKKTRQECLNKPRPHTPAAPPPTMDTTQRSSSRTKVTTNRRTNHTANTNNVIPNSSSARTNVGMVRSPPRQRTEAPQAAPWTGGNSTLASLPMIGLDDSPAPVSAPAPAPVQIHDFNRSNPASTHNEFSRSMPASNHNEFSRSNANHTDYSRQSGHEFPKAPAVAAHKAPSPRTPAVSQHNVQPKQAPPPEPPTVERNDDGSGSSSSSSSDSGSDSDSNSEEEDNSGLPRDVLKDDLCLSSTDSE